MSEYGRLLKSHSSAGARLYICACLLLIAGVALAFSAYQTTLEVEQGKATIARMRKEKADAVPVLSRSEIEENRRWQLLEAEASFPWAKVFNAIERAVDPDVQLMEFRPDKRQKTIILKGRARTNEAVVRYLELLSEQPAFSNVHLVRQQLDKRGNRGEWDFEVRGTINP